MDPVSDNNLANWRKFHPMLLAIVITFASAAPHTAHSQYVMVDVIAATIANAGDGGRHACMTGTPRKEKRVLKAREQTALVMQTYFEAMKTGSSPRSAFFRLDKKTSWTDGTQTVAQEEIDQPADFLAVPDAASAEEPSDFVRAGSGSTAQGRWQVLSEDGSLAGTYTVLFVRKGGKWHLRNLAMARADDFVQPIVQYCAEPGDVLPYRVDQAQRVVSYKEDRVKEAEARIAGYEATLARAQAILADKPKDIIAKKDIKDARKSIKRWQKKRSERQLELEEALENQASVLEEAELAESNSPKTQ